MGFTIPANAEKKISVETHYRSNTNILIDWGDGCIEHLITSGKRLTHIYTTNESVRDVSVKIVSTVSLTSLYCNGNALTTLDVSHCTQLTTLFCQGNTLTALDVSGNPKLVNLNCQSNALTELDVSNKT